MSVVYNINFMSVVYNINSPERSIFKTSVQFIYSRDRVLLKYKDSNSNKYVEYTK
jgi:hypothetical protein